MCSFLQFDLITSKFGVCFYLWCYLSFIFRCACLMVYMERGCDIVPFRSSHFGADTLE